MRERWEGMAASVAMAEEGLWREAVEICSTLPELEARARTKILVVADEDALTQRAILQLDSLLQRFDADVLLVSTHRDPGMRSGAAKGGGGSLKALTQAIASRHFTAHMAIARYMDALLHAVATHLRRIEFVVCVGVSDSAARAVRNLPTFTISPG